MNNCFERDKHKSQHWYEWDMIQIPVIYLVCLDSRCN